MSAPHTTVSILLIEHDTAYAAILEARLRANLEFPYQLTCIPNLTAAFEFIDSHPCHIAIVDLDLPESSGLLTFKALLKHSNHSLPIIALVKQEDDLTLNELFSQGAIDVREKSSTTGIALARAVRAALESARLQKELQQARGALKRLARATREDLSGPLADLGRDLESLAEDLGPEALAPPVAKRLAALRADRERAKRIADDLQNFSESAPPSLRAREVDLAELSRVVAGQLEAEIGASGARVDIVPMPRIEADPQLLTQVLRHLLRTGIRSCSSQPPQISISADDSPTMVVVSLAHNGSFPDRSNADRAFEPNGTSNGNGHGSEDTALGLALCKRIIESHRGRIWIESRGTTGTVFNFSIPKAQRATLEGARSVAAQSPAL